jgi:uncharacterized secreted protein with C-terminal beta-propeller domain
MATAQSPVGAVLEQLRTADTDEERLRMAKRLRDATRTLVQDLTAEHAAVFIAELNRGLNRMCMSSVPGERLASVLAIYELADVPMRDANEQIARFANYLR